MGNSSKKVLVVFILCLTLPALASTSNAAGWGAAGSFGTGNFHFTPKPYLFPVREASGTIEKTGAALVLDPNLARDVLARVLGFGAAAGTNIHLDDSYDLSLSAGARYERYYSSTQYGAINTLKGNAAYAYFTVTFLFRIANGKQTAD